MLEKIEKKIVVPDELCCLLTKQLFRHPVVACNGKTYEMEALQKLVKEEKQVIVLPDGSEIANKFFPDGAMKFNVREFLKENPGYIRPVSAEKREMFIVALSKNDKKQVHLSLCEEPALLSDKLFDNKTVLQHCAEKGESDRTNDILFFLLEIAEKQWDKPTWYRFFENYIAEHGVSFLIVGAIKRNLLKVNDKSYTDLNTLLHLAAKSDHKSLVKQLIIECEADTTLKNANGQKAKDIAVTESGIPQLIKDSCAEKILRRVNEKIENLENQNTVLTHEVNSTKGILQRLESKDKQNDVSIKALESQNAELKNEVKRIKERADKFETAYKNLITMLNQRGFFALQGRLVSTVGSNSLLSVVRKVGRCPYNADNFNDTDTYVTLSHGSSDAPRYRCAYFEDHVPMLSAGLPRDQEEKARSLCIGF